MPPVRTDPDRKEHVDPARTAAPPPSAFAAFALRWLGYLLMLVGLLGLATIKAIHNAGLRFSSTVLLEVVVAVTAIAIGTSGRKLSLRGRKERAAKKDFRAQAKGRRSALAEPKEPRTR